LVLLLLLLVLTPLLKVGATMMTMMTKELE